MSDLGVKGPRWEGPVWVCKEQLIGLEQSGEQLSPKPLWRVKSLWAVKYRDGYKDWWIWDVLDLV